MHRLQRADKQTTTVVDKKILEITTIKSKLFAAGLTLLQVDRLYDLPRGTAGTTLREPNVKGERAIAAALGTRPEYLWRTRYHASGLRKSPQPRENYVRPATMAQRQIGAGA
jgi:Ner family transcriptional regulator